MSNQPKTLMEMTEEEAVPIFNAWREGRTIEEYFCSRGPWKDMNNSFPLYNRASYRIKPKKLNIPWECIRPEFKWAAMDKDGAVCVYENKPSISDVGPWYPFDGKFVCLRFPLAIDTEGVDWRTSLTGRPE